MVETKDSYSDSEIMIIRVLDNIRYLLMVAKDQQEYLGGKCWKDPVEKSHKRVWRILAV